MTSCCRHSFQEGTLWLWLCVLLLISRVSDACTVEERIALLEIRVSLLGSTAGFTNMPQSWQQSDDCCSWDGVACNNVTRHVSHLQLSFLDGVSPENGACRADFNSTAFSAFPELQFLDFSKNYAIFQSWDGTYTYVHAVVSRSTIHIYTHFLLIYNHVIWTLIRSGRIKQASPSRPQLQLLAKHQ